MGSRLSVVALRVEVVVEVMVIQRPFEAAVLRE